jgi:peptide/nickel transport system permease protein
MDSCDLATGIAAVKAGDLSTGRRLLARAVQQNPDSEAAWLWLGGALKTPQGRALCLRQVLALNPANQAARRGLAALDTAPPAPVLVARPLPPRAAPSAGPGRLARGWLRSRVGATQATTPSTFARVARYTLVRVITLSLTVVIGVYLAVILINFGGFIDDIIRDRIAWALLGMSMDMQGMSGEEKLPILEQAERQMVDAAGLNEPFLLRCVHWAWHGLKLDWGEALSSVTGQTMVLDVRFAILEALPDTLLLAGASNLLLFLATVFLALSLSRRYGTLLDKIMVTLSPISSAPNWVFGIILTLIFAAELHLLPFGGQHDAIPPDTKLGYVFVMLKHMILPVAAIFLSMFFQSVYAWRTFFLLYSGENYVEMAEAQGLPPRAIERRYILRPTLPYILTSFALMLITFWQGILALELFFRWPGIGWLFVESVHRPMSNRMAVIALVIAFAYLLAISVFLLDVIYALVDPRVRVGGAGQAEDAAARRRKRRSWRSFWPNLDPLRALGRVWANRPSARGTPVRGGAQLALQGRPGSATERSRFQASPRQVFWDRVQRGASALKPTLREIGRYPSAVVGLAIILLLVGISIYTVIAIPYDEAIQRWRVDRESLYRNPKNAQPGWTNLFRRSGNDLPPTIVLNSRDGTARKSTNVVSENMTEVTISFVFDYPYGDFPQDIAIYYVARYDQKIPLITQTLVTPDGRELELDSFNVPSLYTYMVSADSGLSRRNPLRGQGGVPVQRLLADPAAELQVPLQGTYELRATGFVFEEDSDLDAEFVLHGQVHGLAGTDHYRRDLMVAMLWGVPVALAFGLLGAVCTSLLTMVISAVGVWFGGWVDHLVQRVNEVNMILPALPLAITVYLVYAKSIWVILGVMVLLSIFGSAIKSYRAMFLQAKDSAYIEAARVYGASNWRIIFRYLLPRILPVLIPQLVILIPGYVFLEATLAFLGVSDIYLPTWGKVINDALTNSVFEGYYYWVLEPVALLMLTGLAFAMLGFALDRIFNPRLRTA